MDYKSIQETGAIWSEASLVYGSVHLSACLRVRETEAKDQAGLTDVGNMFLNRTLAKWGLLLEWRYLATALHTKLIPLQDGNSINIFTTESTVILYYL